jgi:hypothetical protein
MRTSGVAAGENVDENRGILHDGRQHKMAVFELQLVRADDPELTMS